MNFNDILFNIQQTKNAFQQNALAAVNSHLTIRNWLIGMYVFEFEQNGEDRAKYGKKIIQKFAEKLEDDNLSYSNLKVYRLFYQIYPQFASIIPAFIQKYFDASEPMAINYFSFIDTPTKSIGQSVNVQLEKPGSNNGIVNAQTLLTKLSFTHLVQLLPIDDNTKRDFYILECIKGTWSVRELKRQIDTLYFERCALSKKPDKLSAITQKDVEKFNNSEFIKSPFSFEFLGLKAKDVVYESDLEQALIIHLEEFLLELGHGFCFEARQKRIIIGDEYFYCDLVFFHRILKCHVLIELKVGNYSYEHYGQLKTYINYYNKEIRQADDNPTVGILLVTNANNALVEYATADNDNDIFVTKYLLQLPTKEQLLKFIERESKLI